MSTSGFLVFTNKTPGNILNAFSEDDTLINVARAFVSLPLGAELDSNADLLLSLFTFPSTDDQYRLLQ